MQCNNVTAFVTTFDVLPVVAHWLLHFWMVQAQLSCQRSIAHLHKMMTQQGSRAARQQQQTSIS
jgi:hypothetical protein